MAVPYYIDIKEFRELGLVSEINRQILHPLGLALSVTVEDDGAEFLDGVWDYRSDPEGFIFGDEMMEEVTAKAHKVHELFNERAPVRAEALGFVIQPVPDER